MLSHYFPILVFMVIAVGIGIAAITIGALFAPHHPDKAKNSAYECGFEPFQDARIPFNVRFYLVAILFLIFDLETAFLFPWAVVFRHLGWVGFASMMLFLLILVVGFIYEWKRGALEWK